MLDEGEVAAEVFQSVDAMGAVENEEAVSIGGGYHRVRLNLLGSHSFSKARKPVGVVGFVEHEAGKLHGLQTVEFGEV